MRDRVYVILLFVTIMLAMSIVCSSCRTPKPSVTTVTEYDSVFVEKLVPYPLPEDTARIRALLECDENGKVVLRWFDEEHTKRVKLQFKLDSLGNLLANFETARDTVYLPVKETTVGKKTMTQSIVTREVEKKLNWWQKLFVWTGGIAWFFAIVFFVCWTNNKTSCISLFLGLIKKI